MRFVQLLCLLLTALSLACAKTRVTRVRDPQFAGRSFASPAVYAHIVDMHQRQLVEEAMVSELGHRGIAARATIHLIPPTRAYTPEERLQILRDAGVDSLVVITAEWGTTEHYVPITGATTNTTGAMQFYGNQATYQEQSKTEFQGGQYVEKPWAKAEFAVVDLGTGRMAWLGTSETKGNALASFDDIRKSACKSVANLMLADRILIVGPPAAMAPTANAAGAAPPELPDAGSAPVAAVAAAPSADVDAGAAVPDDPVARFEGCLIVGDDGQPLGRITRDEAAPDSLVNKKGPHGGDRSARSIFNRSGPYGSPTSAMSAFNSTAASPPAIFCKNAFAAYLTTNNAKTPGVDPRLLSGLLRAQRAGAR